MKKVMLSAAVCAMVFSANAEEVEVAEAVSASVFSSIYAGLGIGGSFFKTTLEGLDTMKANSFIGAFVIGGGKVFQNNAYLGGEFLIDFTKNRKKMGYLNDKSNLQMKGFRPQVDVKLGYATHHGVLGYGKFGCAWSKLSFCDGIHDYSKNKTSFVLGAGAEKIFCKKFSTSIEADYNFGFKLDNKETTGIKKIQANKGWTVRALAKYNIRY